MYAAAYQIVVSIRDPDSNLHSKDFIHGDKCPENSLPNIKINIKLYFLTFLRQIIKVICFYNFNHMIQKVKNMKGIKKNHRRF